MLDSKTQPLDIAKKVLEPQTIAHILAVQGLTNHGFSILDRWALNSPDALKHLELLKGAMGIEILVLTQQHNERKALTTQEAWNQRDQGMSDWEILELAGIEMGLPA